MTDSGLGTAAYKTQPISMKVIIKRSGMSRQAIHFYLRKGLLPKPLRTNRTYALYSPETLELLDIIKECQFRLRLSLNEIVKVMVHANYDPRELRSELDRRKEISGGSQQPAPEGPGFLDRGELLAALQPPPPPRWLDELHLRGLVDGRTEKYSPENVALVQSIWDLCQCGAELDNLQRLTKRIGEQAEAEFAEFRQAVASERGPKGDYTTAMRLSAAFDRFVLYKRKDATRSVFFNKNFSPAERVVGSNLRRVIPSETFLVRMGLNREIDRLLHRLDRDPADKRSLQNLARAYQMRSDWLILFGVAEKILRIDPLDVWATADQTRAMCYLGRVDDSVEILERRVKNDSHPLLKFRLGESLVLRAHNAGIQGLLSAVVRKEMLTAEALHEARDHPNVRRWIMLDRALDNLSVSDPLRLNQPTIEELETLAAEYESIADKTLSPLGRIGLALGKILTAYSLYLVYRREHSTRAEALRRKIVQMDPQCLLAAHPINRSETKSATTKSKTPGVRSSRIAGIH